MYKAFEHIEMLIIGITIAALNTHTTWLIFWVIIPLLPPVAATSTLTATSTSPPYSSSSPPSLSTSPSLLLPSSPFLSLASLALAVGHCRACCAPWQSIHGIRPSKPRQYCSWHGDGAPAHGLTMGWQTVLQGQHLLNDVILSSNHNFLIGIYYHLSNIFLTPRKLVSFTFTSQLDAQDNVKHCGLVWQRHHWLACLGDIKQHTSKNGEEIMGHWHWP